MKKAWNREGERKTRITKVVGVVTLATALYATMVASPVQAQQVNTTTDGVDSWVDIPLFDIFGPGQRFGWGQVFSVPATSSFLDSFSFWARQPTTRGDSEFLAHVATWDDATNSFSDVWTSAGPTNVTSPTTAVFGAAGPLSDWAEQVFTPGIHLNAGQTYLAYLDISEAVDFMDFLGGSITGDGLAGRSVSADGNTGLVGIRNGQFERKFDDSDLAFTASFSSSVVPEPSTVFLLATGLLGLGGMGWVRRRKNV